MVRRSIRHSRSLLLFAAWLLCAVCLLASGVRAQQSFSNTAPITIVDDAAAQPYPSTINVSGVNGPVQSVTVSLTGFHHTWPADVNMLLVGPGGQNVVLMANCGAGNSVSGVNLTFDDTSAVFLPGTAPISTGIYRPTNDASPASFPAPAPVAPWGDSLSAFRNSNANGTWKLYVCDASAGDSGGIDAGWSLNFSTCQSGSSVRLAFSAEPVGSASGGFFKVQPVVSALDPCGDVVTSYNGPVTLALSAMGGAPSTPLQGQITRNAVNGVAVFSGLHIDQPGQGYFLLASASGATGAKSLPFDTPLSVVYVQQGRSGDGSSWSAAFGTIQAAIRAAPAGSAIWVAAGTYLEDLSVTNPVTLLGGFKGTENSVTQRDWKSYASIVSGPLFNGSPTTTVTFSATQSAPSSMDGFTITQPQLGPGFQPGAGMQVDNGTVTISHNLMTGTAGILIKGAGRATIQNNEMEQNGSIALESPGNVVKSNYFHNNGGGLVVDYYGSLVGTLIIDNVFTGNTPGHNGISLYDDGTNGTVIFANNTVAGNDITGTNAIFVDGDFLLANNIIAFNTGGQAVSMGAATLRNNDIFGNDASDAQLPTGLNGGISADPLFVDRAGGDFHLAPGSPCVDAGDDAVVNAGDTDLDGKPRIQGFHVDMGAFETAFGDVDRNGAFDIRDVEAVLRIAGGLTSATGVQVTSGDVLGEGVLDVNDAVALLRVLNGK